MSSHGRRSLWLVLTILLLVSVSYSQTSETYNSDRTELVSRCETAKNEVIAGRALIASYEETDRVKTKALADAERLGILSEEQIELQKIELTKVREALAKERTAMVAKELEVTEYKKALAKVTKKKNFFKSLTKVFATTTVISAAIAAAVILKE